jgi:hypothetical protein
MGRSTAVAVALLFTVAGGTSAANARRQTPSFLDQGPRAFGKVADGTDLPPRSASPASSTTARVMSSHHYDGVVALVNSRGFVCSGVVIGARTIITARHCLPITRALFGADVFDPRDTIDVIESRVPPNESVDVALLRLRTPAPVAPYALRRSATRPLAPELAQIVGFGTLDPYLNRGAGIRRRVSVPVRDWGCDGKAAVAAGCEPAFEMFIPRDHGNDSCRGDSGGGVFEDTPDGHRLIAVISRSRTNSLLPCGDGGIYIRIDKLNDWITGFLEEDR